MAVSQNTPEAVFETLKSRLIKYAEGRELVPWNGGLADMQPGHRHCRVDACGIGDGGTWGHAEILEPVYERAPFAVYATPDDVFFVMGDQSHWGKPFKTYDPDLAAAVCDQWASAFAQWTPDTA